MLSISVELLNGTFRGDPDGTANTGQLSRGEWPPSPMRLFAALVAADGTRAQCSATDGSELVWFERLPPPVIYADSNPHHQPLRPRYVVRYARGLAKRQGRLKCQQEYIGRDGALVRMGIRVSPRNPRIVYSWQVDPPEQSIIDALRRRAARIGYLGTSDSPVRVRVRRRAPKAVDEIDVFAPDNAGDTVINVARPGDLETLDRLYDAWRQYGASVSRAQFPTLRHGSRYSSPQSVASVDRGEVVAWMRLGSTVSGRRVSTVTDLFKQSILAHYQQLYDEPPRLLHGHGFKTKGYEIARYLALADVGFKWSRGRIHGLALWLPPGCDPLVRTRCREAAFAVRVLSGRMIKVTVEPHSGDARPVAAHPKRWQGPSRSWVTAFPAIHERHRIPDLGEVARWCRHAGLPKPIAVRSSRHPLAPGAVDLAPVEVNRPNRPALPYSHIELEFATEFHGPVVIGSGRQRGFGLCIPMDRSSNAAT